ncbi:MAG: serine/threonine protein kinase, partial [Planctomycetota bacterium]
MSVRFSDFFLLVLQQDPCCIYFSYFSGEHPDLEEFCNRYPECGSELRERIENFIFIEQGLTDAGMRDEESNSEKLTKNDVTTGEILGDFKIYRKIGHGGMGTVYEAEQRSLNRKVALKILPAHLTISDQSVKKFYREAEAGGRHRHPGIVSIYTVGEHEGRHFIAQELIEGGRTLADKINELRAKKDFPSGYFRVVARLIAKVADALGHAHALGVIHRDVKPSNILLTQEGDPKVSDFGLAKVEDALSLSRSGEFAGTPYYMSPEQALSHRAKINHRTDIYSLGVTLYEMLTLHRPFEATTSHEVLKKIVTLDPKNPHKRNPRVPRDLSVICMKAMEKVPEKRYQSMMDFGEDLRRFLSGDVISAKPAGLGTRLWKRVKRNPVVSAAVGVALVATVVFAVVLPWVIAQKEKENAALLKIERDKAVAAQKEAEEQHRVAENRYLEVIRLSDVKRLSDLEKDADKLWPAYPENIPGIQEWLIRAEEVLERFDEHSKTLMSLRENALPYGDVDLQRDRETHPQWEKFQGLKNSKHRFVKNLASLEADIELQKGTSDGFGEENPSNKYLENLKKRLEDLAALIKELEKTVSKRRTWRFENTETQWQHDMLAGLVSGLEALSDDEEGLLKKMHERLAFATTIEAKSIIDHESTWDKAIASIANKEECPHYDGLVIEPKVGFVPIGRDPASGLWEFAHLQTGEIPERD